MSRFKLELEADERQTPAIARLRALLKLALRGYGFKCTAISEQQDSSIDLTTEPEAKK